MRLVERHPPPFLTRAKTCSDRRVPKPQAAGSIPAGGALEIAGPQASEQVLYQLGWPVGCSVDLPWVTARHRHLPVSVGGAWEENRFLPRILADESLRV